SVATVVAITLVGCAVHQPFLPTIERTTGWQLSEGCRVYQYGILTDPDCDVLTGEGIAIQITRIRVLNSKAGQDHHTTIGIEFQSSAGSWSFSPPYVALETGGNTYTSPDIDEALVFKTAGRAISPQKMQHDRERYELSLGERIFFRLQFAVPQNEIRDGFALCVTGLHKDGVAVSVPAIKFN